MKRRARGHVVMIAILLIALIGAMALTAPMMLRPAAARLDERIELDRAQSAADAALAQALARIDDGGAPDFAKQDANVRVAVTAWPVADAGTDARWVEVLASLRPRMPTTPATEGLWPCVRLQARVRISNGRARVEQYLILSRNLASP